jgi:SAM-dependent methyltransferase
VLAALKTRLATAWESAYEINLRNIEALLREAPADGSLLDVGCGEGLTTLRFAEAARAQRIVGLEVAPSFAEQARARGIEVTESDLNGAWPIDDESFGVIVSNQVIEHLTASDHFVSEIARTLRRGGLAVVSTENLASWHNVAALTLGWEPFSLTNSSECRSGLGNPLAVHRDEDSTGCKTMNHTRVFAYRGLRELFAAAGLTLKGVVGAGYYPFPARLGRVDPRHAAFVTVAATKL